MELQSYTDNVYIESQPLNRLYSFYKLLARDRLNNQQSTKYEVVTLCLWRNYIYMVAVCQMLLVFMTPIWGNIYDATWRGDAAVTQLPVCCFASLLAVFATPRGLTQLARSMLAPYVYDTGRNSWRRACTRMVSITLADAVITATTTSGLTAIVINHRTAWKRSNG